MPIEKIISSIPSASKEQRETMRRNALSELQKPDGRLHAEAQRVLTELEAVEVREVGALVDELKNLNIADRVVRAFQVRPLTETDEKLVRVLIDNPGSTSTQLTEFLGWKGQSWHLHFGTMCANRAIYLWPAPKATWRNGSFYSGILADFEEEGSRFTMMPEVREAFARLGIKACSPASRASHRYRSR